MYFLVPRIPPVSSRAIEPNPASQAYSIMSCNLKTDGSLPGKQSQPLNWAFWIKEIIIWMFRYLVGVSLGHDFFGKDMPAKPSLSVQFDYCIGGRMAKIGFLKPLILLTQLSKDID